MFEFPMQGLRIRRLTPPRTPVTSLRRWEVPGFTMEFSAPPPFMMEGRQRVTAFGVMFGPARGERAVDTDGMTPFHLRAGDMRLLPEGHSLKAVYAEPAPFAAVGIRPERLALMQEELFGGRPGRLMPRSIPRTPETARLSRLVRSVLHAPEDWGPLRLESLLTLLSAEVLRRAWSEVPGTTARQYSLPPAVTRRVLAYIEANLADSLALSDLAKVAGLSPFHFARCFRRETGLPPHRYVLERRLEGAQVLLADPGIPIADIALRSGFANPSHLATAFRRRFGVTPSRFRQDHA